jgi:hypothetical protein
MKPGEPDRLAVELDGVPTSSRPPRLYVVQRYKDERSIEQAEGIPGPAPPIPITPAQAQGRHDRQPLQDDEGAKDQRDEAADLEHEKSFTPHNV